MAFTFPLMLIGLTALPALAAIYWLRSRSRRAVVSSLAFWLDQRSPRRGGRILHRMQTPLCFFLELLAITLLVLASAGPFLSKRDVVRPLMVVLDDSYSMQAANRAETADTPRRKAEKAVVEELNRNRYHARFLLAGVQPRLVGEPLNHPDQAQRIFSQWTCHNPSSDLSAATALAAEIGGQSARILILTDRPPAAALDGGQIEWWAFGVPLPNVAFTAAARSPYADRQRVLLEATNLSDSPTTTTLTLEGGNLSAAKHTRVELNPKSTKQFFLNLPAASPALRATLGNDVLAIDNRVELLPVSEKPVRVLVDVADEPLRQAIQQALHATSQTIETAERPELVISDKTGVADNETWRLEILGGPQTVALAGPFVIDRNHALTDGLSLENAIWSASPDAPLSGTPIITAGNTLLLTDSEDIAGRHRLQMAFSADLSNVQDMPDWPIFFANLVPWRRGGLPGIAAPNVRLGQSVAVASDRDVDRVEIILPSKTPRTLDVQGRRFAVPTDQAGLHVVKTADAEYPFSCNAVCPDESDLSVCCMGRWGNWNESEVYQDRRISLSWILLLAAVAVMLAHMAVIAKDREAHDT